MSSGLTKLQNMYSKTGDRGAKLDTGLGRIDAATQLTDASVKVVDALVLSGVAVAGIATPGLLPAMIGLMIITSFIIHQVGLNRELKANIFGVKMQIDRILRTINVINDIAEGRGIPLNTTDLYATIESLNKKIMLFASKKTKEDILLLQDLLGTDQTDAAKAMIQTAIQDGNMTLAKEISASVVVSNPLYGTSPKISPVQPPANATRSTGNPLYNATHHGGQRGGLFDGFRARWLTPGSTMQQINNDTTLAVTYYSIMLAEFDIFMRYTDIKPQKNATGKPVPFDTTWANKNNMRQLLAANRAAMPSDKQYDIFYNLSDTVLKEAVNIVAEKTSDEAVLAAANLVKSAENPAEVIKPSTNVSGGRRRTHMRRRIHRRRKTHKCRQY